MKLIKIFFTLLLFTIVSCSYLVVDDKDNRAENLPESIRSEKQYVVGADDIPLFFGLELVEDDSSSFDTMLGNIVISKYWGDIEVKSVREFYLEALPQLVWILIDDKEDQISFKREDDKLEIRFRYASKGLYVRFFISSVL
jgi:hypothetical protein